MAGQEITRGGLVITGTHLPCKQKLRVRFPYPPPIVSRLPMAGNAADDRGIRVRLSSGQPILRNKTMTGPVIDLQAVEDFIATTSLDTSIYLGCDSRRYKQDGKWYANYARVICVHHDSCRGCKLFADITKLPDFGPEISKKVAIRARLLKEVEIVIGLFDEVWDLIGDRNLEIHIDINTKPEAMSTMVHDEAFGWVKGVTGIEPVMKPDALAAMFAADAQVNGTSYFSNK